MQQRGASSSICRLGFGPERLLTAVEHHRADYPLGRLRTERFAPAAWRAYPQQALQVELHYRGSTGRVGCERSSVPESAYCSPARRYGRVKDHKALDSFTATKTMIVKP